MLYALKVILKNHINLHTNADWFGIFVQRHRFSSKLYLGLYFSHCVRYTCVAHVYGTHACSTYASSLVYARHDPRSYRNEL